jgi:hypothetical protein
VSGGGGGDATAAAHGARRVSADAEADARGDDRGEHRGRHRASGSGRNDRPESIQVVLFATCHLAGFCFVPRFDQIILLTGLAVCERYRSAAGATGHIDPAPIKTDPIKTMRQLVEHPPVVPVCFHWTAHPEATPWRHPPHTERCPRWTCAWRWDLPRPRGVARPWVRSSVRLSRCVPLPRCHVRKFGIGSSDRRWYDRWARTPTREVTWIHPRVSRDRHTERGSVMCSTRTTRHSNSSHPFTTHVSDHLACRGFFHVISSQALFSAAAYAGYSGTSGLTFFNPQKLATLAARFGQAPETPALALTHQVVMGFQSRGFYNFRASVRLLQQAFPNKDLVLVGDGAGDALALVDGIRVHRGVGGWPGDEGFPKFVDFVIEGPNVHRWIDGTNACGFSVGKYFPPTTFRLPDCPHETNTFFFIVSGVNAHAWLQAIAEPSGVYDDRAWCPHDAPPAVRLDTSLLNFFEKAYPESHTSYLWYGLGRFPNSTHTACAYTTETFFYVIAGRRTRSSTCLVIWVRSRTGDSVGTI